MSTIKARYERLKPRHEAYVKMIGELLAVLHADGGHYQYEHGTEKAVEDAITKHYKLTRQLAEVKDKIAELQEQVDLQIPAGVMAQQMKLIAELKETAEYETKMRAITYARIDSQELKINELDALLEYSKQQTREAEAERDELKVQLAEYKADAAPEGYVFLSADFSRQAAGHSQFGTVTFIRNKVGRQWWHELPEEQQEITSLHIYGKGTTVIEAMRHAAMEGATE